jgi:NAD(P)-dependent dehydrogenase (short-subunit alcohol dehydrogenase family)
MLGQIDLLFVSVGAAPLRSLRAMTPPEWSHAFDTNVIGIHNAIAEMLPALAPAAIVAVVSSEVATSPRSHLGAYGASKAALEHMMLQWREEHPWLRFTVVNLGPTVPTEFGHDFEPDEIVDAIGKWSEAGHSQMAFMDTDEVCDVLMATFGALLATPSIALPRLELRSPAAIEADATRALETAAASRQPASPG